MPLRYLENHGPKSIDPGEGLAEDQADLPALPQHTINKLGTCRLICGGLMFIGLTLGIFWFQFSKIPADSRPEIWNQLQWRYLFWLLLFLPVDTVAAGLRIWVIGRVLQPGVSLWTCLKAEWANLGLAMLTPSQTGGGFGQIYMLSRGGMQLGTALTVSLISFLGSMVVLLFVGVHGLLSSSVEHMRVFFQGAFVVFFVVFGGLIAAVCWPGSVRRLAAAISRAIDKIEARRGSQNRRSRRIAQHLHTLLRKLIDLCYMHQNNMRRFFRLNNSSFIWVCLLSLVFMLARAIMAYLWLRFLGIPVAEMGHVLQTQLCLIFLIYFAPTPGSSGLAEGASMLMMGAIISAGFVPYYNLLWRALTLYLPAVAGLIFLLWALVKDAHNVVDRRAGKMII
ncbi:MAG: flippase-like domain-containing protein [Deltaproteobacteria bacterium]|nr:flippase-like domain-containing protein [Deltaproteobacteria bacterium]